MARTKVSPKSASRPKSAHHERALEPHVDELSMERLDEAFDLITRAMAATGAGFDAHNLLGELRTALSTKLLPPAVAVAIAATTTPTPTVQPTLDLEDDEPALAPEHGGPIPLPAISLTPVQQRFIAARLGAGFTPSAYQMAVFAFVVREDGWEGKRDGLVSAVAGSGKTSTLVQAARLLDQEALFCAFNAHIAHELEGRLAGTPMTAKTIHSIGRGTLSQVIRGRIDVKTSKYTQIARDLRIADLLFPPTMQVEDGTRRAAVSAAGELVDFARLTLTDPRDAARMAEVAERFGVEVADEELALRIYSAVELLLDEGQRQAKLAGVIDFTDMLWLPAVWHLMPRQLPWVFVDEAQDLNTAQRALVYKCVQPGGRLIAVGDARQAIYGFAGADADSFWTIARERDALLLPLSVCYRCPVSHVRLAQGIVSQIEPAPGAQEGTVDECPEDELAKRVQKGDLILCRLTAPLVSTCLKFIALGIPARVRGRDVAKSLADTIRAVALMPGYRFAEFGDHLTAYSNTQEAKLMQRGDEAEGLIEQLTDRVDAVRACYESGRFPASSAEELIAAVEGLFSMTEQDENAANEASRSGRPTFVSLSTVHRAKGLEEKRVFILKPDKLPLIWPRQSDTEREQEYNLRYVALTRAKDTLVFVRDQA